MRIHQVQEIARKLPFKMRGFPENQGLPRIFLKPHASLGSSPSCKTQYRGFPKLGVPLLGFPIVRTIVY